MARAGRLASGLGTSSNAVQTLQTALQAKAKAEPTFRFYSLWDKIFRQDVLREAYRRCRANHGAPGVDGVSFAQIEERGAESWLGEVRQERIDGNYRPTAKGQAKEKNAVRRSLTRDTKSWRSEPTCGSTMPTRMGPSSGLRMKTPMACCVSTSRRIRTYRYPPSGV